MTIALYRRLLGDRFDVLPPLVRELHDVTKTAVWSGRADVERGRSLVSRITAALFSLPPSGPGQALRVTFEPVAGGEVWTRAYGAAIFRSTQHARGGLLYERVGMSALGFAVDASPDGLGLVLRDARFLGIALPRFLHLKVRSIECVRDGRYWFEVEAHLPGFGLLVRYAGWLERDNGLSA